jgi:hypothetical protein
MNCVGKEILLWIEGDGKEAEICLRNLGLMHLLV